MTTLGVRKGIRHKKRFAGPPFNRSSGLVPNARAAPNVLILSMPFLTKNLQRALAATLNPAVRDFLLSLLMNVYFQIMLDMLSMWPKQNWNIFVRLMRLSEFKCEFPYELQLGSDNIINVYANKDRRHQKGFFFLKKTYYALN